MDLLLVKEPRYDIKMLHHNEAFFYNFNSINVDKIYLFFLSVLG